MPPYPAASRRTYHRLLLAIGGIWLAAVVIGAQSGFFLSLYQPVIAAIVALTIIAPTLWYFASPGLRRHMEHVGHRRIVLFHVWRIPAALLFFWYGLQGQLPPLFWILAGVGDLLAGSYAAYLMFRPESVRNYRLFHVFGFADFVVAVGTGLTFTLLLDPRMAPIAVLPMALIPLFGVGISGATHLMAFDMLRRGVGMAEAPSLETHPRSAAAAS
jgi:hypothetical protein